MMPRLPSVLAVLLAGSLVSVTAGPTDHKETVAEHLTGEHDPQFDHEAFLGKSESDKFDQLSPAEARRRLGMLVDRIDTDKDGFVTEQELQAWVGHVGKRYILDDALRLGPLYDIDGDGYVTFEEYSERVFGAEIEDENEVYDKRYGVTYKDMIRIKRRLFEGADLDEDKKLTKDELADFLHPEEAPHMKEIYVEIRFNNIDRSKDGYITLKEHIDDIWPANQRDREPEWLPTEKKNFALRDSDRDGKLTFEEYRKWLMPDNYDPANVEAEHLIHHADSDMDKKLTKEEILQHQDVFVGSRATEWGGYLNRHDEF